MSLAAQPRPCHSSHVLALTRRTAGLLRCPVPPSWIWWLLLPWAAWQFPLHACTSRGVTGMAGPVLVCALWPLRRGSRGRAGLSASGCVWKAGLRAAASPRPVLVVTGPVREDENPPYERSTDLFQGSVHAPPPRLPHGCPGESSAPTGTPQLSEQGQGQGQAPVFHLEPHDTPCLVWGLSPAPAG